jgi:GNAT superfamily N-acetyltransferase
MPIIELDATSEEICAWLTDFLSPYETQALFLLGNELNPKQQCVLYAFVATHPLEVPRRQGPDTTVLGVCGYYPAFRSCSLFTLTPEASEALGTHVAKRHPITALLGTAQSAKPAYEALMTMGYTPLGAPEKAFFEMDIAKDFRPVPCPAGIIRPLEPQDEDAAIMLLRHMNSPPIAGPITNEERARLRANPIIFCLELDGKIVSLASTNGKAIHAFQILGVVTDPAYRNRGYAKAVCSHLIAFMKETGATRAVLFTGKENAAATRCYRDLGFTITGDYYVALFSPSWSPKFP